MNPALIILAVLALVFALLALKDRLRQRGALSPSARTWLSVSAIFATLVAGLLMLT